jgi:fatty-acyl-CoA synthase
MYPIEFFWRAARRFPERPAVIGPDGRLTFSELARRVTERAAGLIEIDASNDRPICLGAANTVDHLVSLLAVLAAGRIWVPLNPRNGDPELKRIIEFVGPSLILVDEDMGARLARQGHRSRLMSEVRAKEALPLPMGPIPQRGIPLDRTQAIKFTGGTTGFPKGVKQPLRAWNTNIATQVHTMALTPDDRYLVAAPITHGTSTYMLPVLGSGGALILPDEAKPSALLAAAEQHRATLFFAPPTLIMALTEEQRHCPRDLSALRYLVYGGAPMRLEQVRDTQNCFGLVLGASYGQTEAPQIATFLFPHEMTGDDVASVGRPTMLTQVAIVAPDGRSLPVGEDGEVAIRGDLVMTGYLHAEEETGRTLVDGWLRTGDVGSFDDRGLLFLKDRIRDVIITGGFNVYPSDVEAVIAAHPSVADCSVIGVADKKWGEAVHAAVQVRADHKLRPADLLQLVKRELGSVKTPKEIHIFESLPRSAVGKILKPAIREEILRRQELAGAGHLK